MRNQRGFSLEFKRQVVEELMSGESGTCLNADRFPIVSLPIETDRSEASNRFVAMVVNRCQIC